MADSFAVIKRSIINDPMNVEMKSKGYQPLYSAGAKAQLVIIGQAPGIRAQESMKPWDDASGATLRSWFGISDEQFYDPNQVALIPMDFYYPGKGASGDLPPRKGFAEKWHGQLLDLMPNVQLIILIGAYAQKYYLGESIKKNLTETVRSHRDYAPTYFPLVHPSPLNFRWQAKNPWFEKEVVPKLRENVARVLQAKV